MLYEARPQAHNRTGAGSAGRTFPKEASHRRSSKPCITSVRIA